MELVKFRDETFGQSGIPVMCSFYKPCAKSAK